VPSAATLTRRFANYAIIGVKNFVDRKPGKFCCVIPEIEIWHDANLMLKRYGEKALEESAARADELAAQDDSDGVAHRRCRPARKPNTARTATLTVRYLIPQSD
jgi:hypothetical protein